MAAVYSFYLTAAVILLMFAYAGYDETMKFFTYINLQIRYFPLRVKIEFMKFKLKKELDRDVKRIMKDRQR
tara:strand:+ start:3307 stop:3519 length:213 start_codon:yes stop_codon:yes gene_type:complete